MDEASADSWLRDAGQISDGGERVSHLFKDPVFYAHLSIYDFARRFCQDARVLDAGCGAGYGAAYLADNGARHIWGIDASEKAIAFSRYHFRRPNLEFQVMDLGQISGFSPQSFDFIYTSNTLEHVADLACFFRQACRLLKPAGTLLSAVPPITDDRLLYLNLVNPYHLHLWTPRQWLFVLEQYFGEVAPYLHGVEKSGADFKPEHFTADSTLTEKGFVIEPGAVDDMVHTFTMTAIFVARHPRSESALPAEGEPPTMVDESFSRPQGYIAPEMRQKLRKYFEADETSKGSEADSARSDSILQRMWAFVKKKGFRDPGYMS